MLKRIRPQTYETMYLRAFYVDVVVTGVCYTRAFYCFFDPRLCSSSFYLDKGGYYFPRLVFAYVSGGVGE